MQKEKILANHAMPQAAPGFGLPPYRFINREYFIITYESDKDAIRAALPEPLQPDPAGIVLYEWIKMPDSSGLGSYEESGIVIPCTYQGEACNFTAQMYLDNGPAILAGREIWGFPKKFAKPSLTVRETETLTGTLHYNDMLVALGTIQFKYHALDTTAIAASMGKMQINLKQIPQATGRGLEICQLIGYRLENIQVKGAWSGDARLHLTPHVNAPVADLPVKKIVGAKHFIADLTLPFGQVLVDYLNPK